MTYFLFFLHCRPWFFVTAANKKLMSPYKIIHSGRTASSEPAYINPSGPKYDCFEIAQAAPDGAEGKKEK